MHIRSVPTGTPSSQVSYLKISGLSTWLRTLTMSPFHAWWIAAVPLTRFWVEAVEIPRANSFWTSSVSFEISSSFGSGVFRSKPLSRLASPIASWKSSRMNIRPSPSGLVRSFQEPVIPCDLVLAPGDPGRVVGVGDGELALRVPPAGVVEGRDPVGVLQVVAVEVGEQALLVEPGRVLGGRPDHVVLAAGPELGHHRLEVVEVDLVDLDAVLLAEALLQRRVHVLGPVVDQQVAVDLRLDRDAALGAVDRALDPAAGERAEPVERRARPPAPARSAWRRVNGAPRSMIVLLTRRPPRARRARRGSVPS